MPNQLLQEAIDLIQAGETTGAKTRVFAVLRTEPRNADAWYLAAYLLDGRDKQIQALQRALAINPAHTRARAALAKLQPPATSLDDLLEQKLPPPASVTRPTPPVAQRPQPVPVAARRPQRRSLVPLLLVTIFAVTVIGITAVLLLNKVRNEQDGPITLTAIAQAITDTAIAGGAGDTTATPTPGNVDTDYQNTAAAILITNTQVELYIQQTATANALIPTLTDTTTSTATTGPTNTAIALPSDTETATLAATSTPIPTSTLIQSDTATTTSDNVTATDITPSATASNTSAALTATPFTTPAVTVVALLSTGSPSATATSVPGSTATLAPTSAGTLVLGAQNDPIPQKQVYRFAGLGRMSIQSGWASGQTGLAIVKVVFTCERPATQHCNTSNFLFNAVGDSSTSYGRTFESDIPNPGFGDIQDADLQGGKTATGYIGFQIAASEHKLLLDVGIYRGTKDIFFSIG